MKHAAAAAAAAASPAATAGGDESAEDAPARAAAPVAAAPCISSYQLIVSFHEAAYQREFPATDLSDYTYQSLPVERIYVAPQHVQQGPLPAPPLLQQPYTEQQQRQQQQQQQQQGPPPSWQQPPPPPRQHQTQMRRQQQRWQQPSPRHHHHHHHHFQQQQQHQQAQGAPRLGVPRLDRGGFRSAEDEVDDKILSIAQACSPAFKVTLDRRLRPVVLAVHKKATCPLPLLASGGVNARSGVATVDAVGGAGISREAHGGCSGGRGELRDLEQAVQNMVNVIYRERMSPLDVGSGSDGGEICGSAAGGSSGGPCGGADMGGRGVDRPATAPPPPLVIFANEGDWRDSRCIHLKAPVAGAAEYARLLRELLGSGGSVLKNHADDPTAVESVLRSHHAHLTAVYTSPYLRPAISNFTRLGDAAAVLGAHPELFFKLEVGGEEAEQLAGGEELRAVWYGSWRLPRLVATLPGRPLNGLSLGEALGCMRALWGSELRRRLFTAPEGVRKAAGLTWVLLPCFAE